MGRAVPGVVVICAALSVGVGASSSTHAANVPVLEGTWDITTKVLANNDATGWLGPTYNVGASNKRVWRFEQPCKGVDCETDLVRVTDVSEAKTRIAYRGGNEFTWKENLSSTDTCNTATFQAVKVRTSFVMKVKTVPIPTGRPFATSLEAVGRFIATVNVDAYVKAGCRAPPAQISYTIRYRGTSPDPPPDRNQVFGGPAPGLPRGTVKLPGSKASSAITPGQPIPRGTVVDVSNGRGVTLADPKGAKTAFSGQRGVPSIFVYTGVVRGFAELQLTGGDFRRCKDPVRSLLAKGKGAFRTKGRYASAAGRSATWSMADDCTRTLVEVKKGQATVRDLPKRETVTVRAGSSYSASPGG